MVKNVEAVMPPITAIARGENRSAPSAHSNARGSSGWGPFREVCWIYRRPGGGKKVHVPADVNAIKFFLINRKPEEWRDKFSYEHTTSDLPAMLEEAFARVKKAREEGN